MNQQSLSHEQMVKEFLALKAENERLKANKSSINGIKASVKGAVSVYGLGRLPVTLYASQWKNLFERQADILAFIEANKSVLKTRENVQ